MTDLKPFIEQARAKGLGDDQIREALKSQGWDESIITMGLTGLDVPKPENTSSLPAPSDHAKHPSISPLVAALHHVLLWFFVGSSTVTIAGVVASLTGEDISAQALAAMIAVTVVTFLPYAVLFITFLRQVRHTPDLVPGKVWSIITVCLHSIAAMIAAITLVVSLITESDISIPGSAAIILGLDLIVVMTYYMAVFNPNKTGKSRKFMLYGYLPLLGVLFGILFVLSLLQLGPARHDDQLRKDLTTTVQNIAKYSNEHHKLPSTLGNLRAGQGVEYTKRSFSTYEVCGSFMTVNKNHTYDYGDITAQNDSYVYEGQFYPTHTGRNCFEFTAAALMFNNSTGTFSPRVQQFVQ